MLHRVYCAGVQGALTVQAVNTHCQSELLTLLQQTPKAMQLHAKHTIWLVDFADGRHVTLAWRTSL